MAKKMGMQERLRRWETDWMTADLIFYIHCEGWSRIDAAREVGLSAGKSTDEKKQRIALSSAASRALRSNRAKALLKKLDDYSEGREAELPPVLDEQEYRTRLTKIARGNDERAALQAIKLDADLQRRGVQQSLAGVDFAAMVKAMCDSDRSLGLQVIGLCWWRAHRGSIAGLRDWQPPEHLKPAEAYLERFGPEPFEIASILEAARAAKARAQ